MMRSLCLLAALPAAALGAPPSVAELRDAGYEVEDGLATHRTRLHGWSPEAACRTDLPPEVVRDVSGRLQRALAVAAPLGPGALRVRLSAPVPAGAEAVSAPACPLSREAPAGTREALVEAGVPPVVAERVLVTWSLLATLAPPSAGDLPPPRLGAGKDAPVTVYAEPAADLPGSVQVVLELRLPATPPQPAWVAAAQPPPSEHWTRSMRLPLLGVAVASAAAGAWVGGSAWSDYQDLRDDPMTRRGYDADVRSIDRRLVAADVLFGVAAVAAVSGFVIHLATDEPPHVGPWDDAAALGGVR